MKFSDRNGINVNRRKLKIIQGNLNDSELIVDIERAETSVTEEGTPINADTFNQWNLVVEEVKINTDIMKDKISKLLLEPDCTEVNNQGVATVELVNGKFKFSNLKGADGEKYAIAEAHGLYAFRINEEGYLCVNHNEDKAPDFVLRNGELIYNF